VISPVAKTNKWMVHAGKIGESTGERTDFRSSIE
jgi:hypothetical protein